MRGAPGGFLSLSRHPQVPPPGTRGCRVNMGPGGCLCEHASENSRPSVASGLHDLVVISHPVILVPSEGSLVPVTKFVVTPMGIRLQKTCTLLSRRVPRPASLPCSQSVFFHTRRAGALDLHVKVKGLPLANGAQLLLLLEAPGTLSFPQEASCLIGPHGA